MSTVARRDYVYELFERQCEIALQNLARIAPLVGDRVDVIYITGTDFGTQTSQFLSVGAYRQLYKPFHKRVNDWVHTHTPWKTFMHTDGALMPLIPDFMDAGFDILQPIQFTAKDMDPATLKAKFGNKLVFWGAGIDTQHVLPFGAPEEVRAQVRVNVRVFSPGGGYVFGTVHNVQPQTPVENLVAMYEAVAEFR
jgi:uroporphyrinogen-III decarboxylase